DRGRARAGRGGDRLVVRTVAESSRLRVRPGRPATLFIDVTNTSAVIDGITAVVAGIAPSWRQLIQPLVALFPEATGRLALRFDVPTSFPAGDVPVIVRVFSTIDAQEIAEHDVLLIVEPVEAGELQLRPSLVNGGSQAEMRAVI